MPVKSKIHIDAALSSLLGNEGVGKGFAFEQVFPQFPVEKLSDEFFTLEREEIRQDIPTKRSAREKALEWDWEIQSDAYSCHFHKLKSPVTDDDLKNADPVLNLREITAIKIQYKIRLDMEKECREILTDTSSYLSSTPEHKWNDLTWPPDIFGDIDSAKEIFRKNFGILPNLIIFEPKVASTILNNKNFIKRINRTSKKLVLDNEMPKKILNMRTFVPNIIENWANPTADESVDDIWDTDKVFLLYANPSKTPKKGEPSFGYNIVWRKYGSGGWKVKSWTTPDPEREYILAGHYHEFKIVASHGLYILNDVLS